MVIRKEQKLSWLNSPEFSRVSGDRKRNSGEFRYQCASHPGREAVDLPQQLDYLVIAAHPDDAEIGVGGTILSLKSQGASVGILDLTSGEPTPHGSPEIRQRETEAATKILGVDWRGNLGLPNRSLIADLDARRQLAGWIRQLKPRILLAHYWEDAHPDHLAASTLTDAARFWAKLSKTDMPGEPHHPARIFYFLSVHLRLHIQPSFIVDVSAHHDAKIKALECYHSQFTAGRAVTPPTFLDDVRDRARYWGWTIGTRYGEQFICREEVGLQSLQHIVV
jgi:N-acetylglucosamine malate deacetylase 1